MILRAAHHIEALLIYRDFLRDWLLSNLDSLTSCVMFRHFETSACASPPSERSISTAIAVILIMFPSLLRLFSGIAHKMLVGKRTREFQPCPFFLWHFSSGDKIENCPAQFLAVCWIVHVQFLSGCRSA